MLIILAWGCHRNGNYWQSPLEFLPDRFDPEHELSRTPSGQKRHSFAWFPFNGGKRICFGKTFSELNLKVIVTMMIQRFDISLVDKERYSKNNLPLKVVAQSHNPPLWVEIRERE